MIIINTRQLKFLEHIIKMEGQEKLTLTERIESKRDRERHCHLPDVFL